MPSYVVTGGRGIGYEFANQLSSKAENTVFVIIRNIQTVPKFGQLVKERSNLHAIEADLTDLPSLKRAANEVGKVTGGTLDVLINNAAWQQSGANAFKGLYQLSDEGLEDVLVKELNEGFQTNVVGVIHTINSFIPLLRAGKTKKVITLSTGMADIPMIIKGEVISASAYSISKAGTNVLNAKYAVEFKDEGFIFLAISPGLVATHTERFTDAELEGFGKMVANFQKAYPHFTGQPITPTESVNYMLPIIDTLKPEENGEFLSHLRSKEWL